MNNTELVCLQARGLLSQGQVREAVAAIRTLLDAQPEYADGWLVLSEIQAAAGNFQQASMACDRALSLAPNSIDALLQYCRCGLAAGSASNRVQSYALQLAEMALADPHQLNELGRIFASMEQHEMAEAQYRHAIGLRGDEPGFYYNLATAQRFLGKLSDAEESLRRVLELNPRDSEAYLLLSGLRRQDGEFNHIAPMQALLADGGLPARERVNLHYALAKELEDLGHYKGSFQQLESGARLRRQNMRYNLQGDLAVMQSLQRNFDSGFFARCVAGCESVEPIFILGMPRTGSTLLERILSSHSQVQSAGELNNFALQMMKAVHSASTGSSARLTKLQLVEASRGIDFGALGVAYIDSTRLLTGKKPHFIDKLPFNYLYIGLIHAALPNAKIIHMQRHPMDTCYAIYKQLFESAYPFSYDLEELGNYYLAYRQLMDHWQEVLPGRICEVRYEDLVENVEATAHRVMDYCGLEWQVQCLDFYRSREASTTASAAQVRQPIYSSSIGKWKNYRQQLQPLVGILQAGGIEVD
ncbi:tetratricopeptide repeat-containing sulfotransferase family protein [Microbulbifer taiwanensis]|uniref:Sulfotransferase n=1 Tax=Microbulbifer taiwanensis TaxID=986746 RepID=A0ABW1YKW8_9GAMM|nr:sulfotransferase [Microbulbifer taiwanensis]